MAPVIMAGEALASDCATTLAHNPPRPELAPPELDHHSTLGRVGARQLRTLMQLQTSDLQPEADKARHGRKLDLQRAKRKRRKLISHVATAGDYQARRQLRRRSAWRRAKERPSA